MKSYFIDTENVGSDWIPLLEKTEKGDQIILFYTEHSAKLSFKTVARLLTVKAKVECIYCYLNDGRPNALDFQLSTILGSRIQSSRHKDREFIIVTRDQGYDSTVRLWQERGICVSRFAPAQESAASGDKCTQCCDEQCMIAYMKELTSCGFQEEAEEIAYVLLESMRKPKQERKKAVYQSLLSQFGYDSGIKIYQRIRHQVYMIASHGPVPVPAA